jgi:hypothetical protein
MKTKTQNLAEVFTQIQSAANAVEDISKGILAAIKAAKATTPDKFNVMVEEAYKVNGWSQKAGRRLEGDTTTSAPRAVTFYVSTVRAAYRLKLKVITYDLMQAVRDDIAAARKAARKAELTKSQPAQAPEVVGIQVQQENALTGALWHDAVVLWEHLPGEQRALFEGQVRRLLTKYRKDAPPELLKAA